MPLYEYECRGCSARFEVKRSFSESGNASCPLCEGEGRRIFSPIPIFFKGPGFYVTDSSGNRRNGAVDRQSSGDQTAAAAAEKSGR
ncbi:MAG: zinc ribbon domain-containing protein [Dehalococcoidia bacterium]|nr:zinc ribbon domain-containing protein [Dehalococcoidia bacterium]